MTSPHSGKKDPEQVFRSQLKSVIRNLERAIDDLMEHFWEEPLRRHAYDLAEALLAGCKTYGAEGHAGFVKFRNLRIREL